MPVECLCQEVNNVTDGLLCDNALCGGRRTTNELTNALRSSTVIQQQTLQHVIYITDRQTDRLAT